MTLYGVSVGVEDELLSNALRELPENKIEILLRYYFMNMSDSEIGKLISLNRSIIYRNRTSGLSLIKKAYGGKMKKNYPMNPFSEIVKATDGETEAINRIISHYRRYIIKCSLRRLKYEFGNQTMVVDKILSGRMQTRLITKILSFEIK